MAERSKALDSSSSEGNLAWVQIPLRAIQFFSLQFKFELLSTFFWS